MCYLFQMHYDYDTMTSSFEWSRSGTRERQSCHSCFGEESRLSLGEKRRLQGSHRPPGAVIGRIVDIIGGDIRLSGRLFRSDHDMCRGLGSGLRFFLSFTGFRKNMAMEGSLCIQLAGPENKGNEGG